MVSAVAESSDYAPCKTIPPEIIINVEHPGIVKNIDRAVASLGGEERLGQYLHDGPAERSERNLKLNLRPEDPFRIGIDATALAVSNLVVRVSVPKYTGRKRKRGSTGPFVTDNNLVAGVQPSSNTADLLRCMRDNAASYAVSVVGQSSETHRFRKLPDFQYSVMQSSIARRLKDHMLPYEYAKIVDFRMDPVSGGCQADEDLVPPPKFSQLDVPFNYLYLDNPGVSQVDGKDGKLERKLRSAKIRSRMHVLSADAAHVPTEPSPECQPEESLPAHYKKILSELRALLEERPVITRRAALNLLSHDYAYDLRHTVQYCSYMFKSGPFKDAYCKFGVDPRKDPEMRKYQTLVFQLKKRSRPESFGKDSKWTFSAKGQVTLPRGQRSNQTHVFDGHTAPATDGKTYQVCDITDPLLVRFLSQATVRPEFEPSVDGWFCNGTWATLRIIIKDKIELLQAGLEPENDDYEKLFELPSMMVEGNQQGSINASDRGTKASLLASQIRAAAMSGKYRGAFGGRATWNRIADDNDRGIHGSPSFDISAIDDNDDDDDDDDGDDNDDGEEEEEEEDDENNDNEIDEEDDNEAIGEIEEDMLHSEGEADEETGDDDAAE